MISVVLLVAQLFVPDPEASAYALDQAARLSVAKNCVAIKAAEYARYTAETADEVARYAVRQCGKEISAIAPTSSPQDTARALIPLASIWVMEWRVRASKRGASEWDVINREVNPLE